MNKREHALRALPRIAQQIERNHAAAYHYYRRAFEQLVIIGSPGKPETGDAALDRFNDDIATLINDLMDMLEAQQSEIEALGGDGKSSRSDSDKPCATLLELYQAAITEKDMSAAQRYLAEYSNCTRSHSGDSLKLRVKAPG